MSIIKEKAITFLKNYIQNVKNNKKNIEPIFFSSKSSDFHWTLHITHTYHQMYEIQFNLLENLKEDDDEYYLKNILNVSYRTYDDNNDNFILKIIDKMNYFISLSRCYCSKFYFTNDDMCVNCKLTLPDLKKDCPICLEPMVDSTHHNFIEKKCGTICHLKCKIKSKDNKCIICRIIHCPKCGSEHDTHEDDETDSNTET